MPAKTRASSTTAESTPAARVEENPTPVAAVPGVREGVGAGPGAPQRTGDTTKDDGPELSTEQADTAESIAGAVVEQIGPRLDSLESAIAKAVQQVAELTTAGFDSLGQQIAEARRDVGAISAAATERIESELGILQSETAAAFQQVAQLATAGFDSLSQQTGEARGHIAAITGNLGELVQSEAAGLGARLSNDSGFLRSIAYQMTDYGPFWRELRASIDEANSGPRPIVLPPVPDPDPDPVPLTEAIAEVQELYDWVVSQGLTERADDLKDYRNALAGLSPADFNPNDHALTMRRLRAQIASGDERLRSGR